MENRPLSPFELGQFLRNPRQFAQRMRSQQQGEEEARALELEEAKTRLQFLKSKQRLEELQGRRNEAIQNFGTMEQTPAVNLGQTDTGTTQIPAPIQAPQFLSPSPGIRREPLTDRNARMAGVPDLVRNILANNQATIQNAPIQNVLRHPEMTIPGVYGEDMTVRPRTREEVKAETISDLMNQAMIRAQANQMSNLVTYIDPVTRQEVTTSKSVAPSLINAGATGARQEQRQTWQSGEYEKNRALKKEEGAATRGVRVSEGEKDRTVRITESEKDRQNRLAIEKQKEAVRLLDAMNRERAAVGLPPLTELPKAKGQPQGRVKEAKSKADLDKAQVGEILRTPKGLVKKIGPDKYESVQE